MLKDASERQPLVVFHANCADGAAAALAAFYGLRGKGDYLPAQYGDAAPTDDDVRGRRVFIVDFSYPRAELDRIAVVAEDLVVLDHHKTSAADLAGAPYARFDMARSGAMLAYDHFGLHEQSVPSILFRYVEDRDLWKFKLPQSREINAALQSLDFAASFREFDPLMIDWPHDKLVSQGTAILRAERKLVTVTAGRAELLLLDGEPCAVVQSQVLQSEVCDAILSAPMPGRPETDSPPMAAAYFWHPGKGRYIVSLRSRPGYDCSAVAKRHGGGGHATASGFTCETLPFAGALTPATLDVQLAVAKAEAMNAILDRQEAMR
jgi:uncharacterized protein